jgi:hypothetical protein
MTGARLTRTSVYQSAAGLSKPESGPNSSH